MCDSLGLLLLSVKEKYDGLAKCESKDGGESTEECEKS